MKNGIKTACISLSLIGLLSSCLFDSEETGESEISSQEVSSSTDTNEVINQSNSEISENGGLSEDVVLSSEVESSSFSEEIQVTEGNFRIKASGLDSWGLHGDAKNSILVPDADVFSGGNSLVLDPSDNIVGPCPQDDATCSPNWDISGTFVEIDFSVEHLSSKLKITDFVPSSKAGWGFATAGWWVVPSYDESLGGETAFDKASAVGLSESSWISMKLSYSKGETLTLQLKGEDIDENDGLQSPPRFSYTGTGSMEVVDIPMKAIKRAGWSVPATYDASKMTAIGLLRIEAALAEGAQFPSSAPEVTELKFECISSGNQKGENSCQ
jgi:hypothetical protein